jgi:hypothetical protein
MPASDIASSNTIIESASPSAPGFGVPIIGLLLTAPQDALWGANLIQETTQSTWPADLTALGFSDGDPVWEELQIGFAQDVVPPKVLLGKRATPVAQVTNFDLGDAGAAADGLYRLTLEGTEFDVNAVGQTRAQVVTSMIGFVDADPRYDAVNGGDPEQLDVTAAVAGIGFSFAGAAPTPDVWVITPTTANVGMSTDIFAWEVERSDWYFVTELSRSAALNTSMVGPVNSFTRAIVFVSQVDSATDPDALDGASSTRAAALITTSQRTAVAYVPTATDHDLAAAYFRLLPEDPGGITWANWALKAIDGDRYSKPNTSALQGKGTDPGNYWYFEDIPTLAPTGITRGMRMGDRTPFDLVRGRDWLDAQIETFVGQTLISEPKIGYTDAGSEQIIGVIAGQLTNAVNVGLIIADSYTVTTTPRNAQVPADIAARVWRGYDWTATLVGAQESVEISGTLFIV